MVKNVVIHYVNKLAKSANRNSNVHYVLSYLVEDLERLNDNDPEIQGFCQRWWDRLSEYTRCSIRKIPGFDSQSFEQCTGMQMIRNVTSLKELSDCDVYELVSSLKSSHETITYFELQKITETGMTIKVSGYYHDDGEYDPFNELRNYSLDEIKRALRGRLVICY